MADESSTWTADRPLVRDVLLRDGTTLRLRAPSADDYDDLKAFYDALSPESRYMRFHGFGRSDLAARLYAEADGIDRVALVGRHEGRIVAAAGYDRLREPGTAEVAFTIADDYRRRGAATRLLEQLAAIAAGRGIRRFDAEVLAENRPMLGVFRRAGFALRRRGEMGEVTVSLDLTPTSEVLERIDERDHIAAVASLRPLLSPRSVAVIGAAPDPGNIGAAVVARLVEGGFRGVVAPIGAEGAVVRSMRAAPAVADLAEPPELAIVDAAAVDMLPAAREAVDAGCRGLLVLGGSADPRAADPVPARLALDRLLEVVRGAGARVIGPGSLGILNTDPEVSLHASPARAPVTGGRLAICSQSGALGVGLLGQALARRLGVSAFVSLGDRVDVSTNDLLELWEEDERTAAVMLYVETFGNPERFARIARRVSRRKPILAVKGHRSPDPPRREARSHTAAALHGDAAVDAMLRQAGIMRFRSGEELFNAAQFFGSQPLPHGRRVAVVANSGGMATIARDACVTRGLLVGEVGRGVEGFGGDGGFGNDGEGAAGGEAGGGEAGGGEAGGSEGHGDVPANPTVLPIGAASGDYAAAVRALLAHHDVDALVALYVDLAGGDPAAVLAGVERAAEGLGKPVVASVVGADGHLPDCPAGAVPNVLFPEACAAVIARAVERREWLSRPLGQVPAFDDLDAPAARELVAARLAELPSGDEAGAWLALADCERLLATHGIEVVPAHACGSVDEAVAAAEAMPGPLAVKADFPPPAHASDVDAVLLGVQGADGVRAGWRELERRAAAAGREWRGVLVQPLAPPGADVLVGTLRDRELGPLMAVGLGGRHAGLGTGVACRMLPVTDVDADELIDGARGVAVQLAGFRGQPPLDQNALRRLVLRFAELLRAVPEVLEADLNPTRVTAEGCRVLDVRMRIGRQRPPERTKTW